MQDSAAHARRGVGPAVDIPGSEGQPCQPPAACEIEWGNDQYNGNYVWMRWQGSRGYWDHRFSHLQEYGKWRVGHTGQTTGPHIHWVVWLDDVRVVIEEQPEFLALLP